MILMAELRVLITAAGKGSRAGLPYPKTLYPIQGKPILVRLHELLSEWDAHPTVIVNGAGESQMKTCLSDRGYSAHWIIQSEPKGMGDAVLKFQESPAYESTDDILLVWGDIPFLQPGTVAAVVDSHREHQNDFTFATRVVESAYTVVTRDGDGDILKVIETREGGSLTPMAGEREIGFFVFRKDPVLAMLREDLPDKYGKTTGEHGFLYVIGHLVSRGYRVQGLPIATDLDLISLNSLKDVESFL